MQLVGQTVSHKTFGQGVITDFSSRVVTVCFSNANKKFIYPDAFMNFLTLTDKAMQRQISAVWDKQAEDENTKKQQLLEELERRRRIRAMKITPNTQAAFHVERKDIEKIFADGAVSSGRYLSGYSKGEPRIPSRLKPNSACLLTACPDDSPGERRIIGAFMVEDDFWGSLCTDGRVKIHGEHRIMLKPENSLRFWDYFDHGGDFPRWGSPAFKYFSNTVMQQILLQLKKAVAGTEDEARMEGFYEYFCKINRLPERTI